LHHHTGIKKTKQNVRYIKQECIIIRYSYLENVKIHDEFRNHLSFPNQIYAIEKLRTRIQVKAFISFLSLGPAAL